MINERGKSVEERQSIERENIKEIVNNRSVDLTYNNSLTFAEHALMGSGFDFLTWDYNPNYSLALAKGYGEEKINNIRLQEGENLKRDFISMVDLPSYGKVEVELVLLPITGEDITDPLPRKTYNIIQVMKAEGLEELTLNPELEKEIWQRFEEKIKENQKRFKAENE